MVWYMKSTSPVGIEDYFEFLRRARRGVTHNVIPFYDEAGVGCIVVVVDDATGGPGGYRSSQSGASRLLGSAVAGMVVFV